ncbi:MAG: hypothetical protein QM820_10780 [Minicystis sp.]
MSAWLGCHLEIEARGEARGEAARERLRLGIVVADRAHEEGPDLDGRLGLEPDEPVEPAVLGDLAGRVARDVGPLVQLLAHRDVALDLQAPALHRARGEAQRAERDAQLRRPAGGGARDLGDPVLVPVLVELGVVEVEAVREHARGVDRELEGALAVAARVEHDGDRVRLDRPIAPREPRHDVDRLRAVDADVDVVVVVEDAHDRAIAGRLAVDGDLLGEAVAGDRLLPHGVVEPPVDLRRPIDARGREVRHAQREREDRGQKGHRVGEDTQRRREGEWGFVRRGWFVQRRARAVLTERRRAAWFAGPGVLPYEGELDG